MPGEQVTILVRQNGPLRVYGPARLVDADGNEYEVAPGEWFSLCRCGHSSRKPFCDSTHKAIDFKAQSLAQAPPQVEYSESAAADEESRSRATIVRWS